MQPARMLTMMRNAKPEAALLKRKLKAYEKGIPKTPKRMMMRAKAPQPSWRRNVSLSSRISMRAYMMKAELRYSNRSQARLDSQNTPGDQIKTKNVQSKSYLA